MLTQAPAIAARYRPPEPGLEADDLSGHRHRQVIGYLGLALPILLVWIVRLRPNLADDQWSGTSISAYYWTGAVALFSGLLAALSLFLLTYRGYANEAGKYDRAAATVAGIAAATVALFPTRPPAGIRPPWYADWIATTHVAAAVVLFTMFAIFALWLFRKGAPGEEPTPAKRIRNAVYLVCGIGIVAGMIWAFAEGLDHRSVFWPESLMLGCFACSWLVKGRALRSIRRTARAVKEKLAE